MNLFIQKNENYSFKEDIHSSEKLIIAQGYAVLQCSSAVLFRSAVLQSGVELGPCFSKILARTTFVLVSLLLLLYSVLVLDSQSRGQLSKVGWTL